MPAITQTLHRQLQLSVPQINAFIQLYDAGNTVPFIARYRKEATYGLDDTQLRQLESSLLYQRDLAERKEAIYKSLLSQNKLSAALKTQIINIDNKRDLETLYQPFKSKRVSKAKIAMDAGLMELADKLWFQDDMQADALLKRYINKKQGFNDEKSVLQGASDILIERLSLDISLSHKLVETLHRKGLLSSSVIKAKQQEAQKFKDYFDYSERLKTLPAHRYLALLRAKSEGFLRLKVDFDMHSTDKKSVYENLIADHLGFSFARLSKNSWRKSIISEAWQTKLNKQTERQIFSLLKEQAHSRASQLFATNLKDLLMAAPAGEKIILGLDPGFKSGCKIVVISGTGKLLDFATIYPHAPQRQSESAKKKVDEFIKKYHVQLIAIGNGTASRESDDFIKSVLEDASLNLPCVMVSEAGASVYSASELACIEFPQLDVSIRGAVSIARRLQDPLAELVKIDAKAIGVGLYQHDLNQVQLGKNLQVVVEDCVNAIGVDVNRASVQLLTFIAGLNKSIAENIVQYRDTNGPFTSRSSLMKVPRLGAKAYQQAAGFLRIIEGIDPLDNSAVHPEAYALVSRIAIDQNCTVKALLKNSQALKMLDIDTFISEQFGRLSIEQIISELAAPRRDPRPDFCTVSYSDEINKISDLYTDMEIQGVITNVTSFGAFVDIGVHQDGLIHLSQLANKFVKDPFEVVKTGQIVQVRVLSVDSERKRISLSLRLQDHNA
ncbi:RNA-binding S1 domain-containing protein [Psychromonas sp. CNPT3]|uniref:Tex family protein n=1 Tax=Psychromonas sp. CNPT3 TaxID=314282 RepID=UPI00006E34E4|nr:Tex family protein [Psychromonas sp. CNPT3]AGH81207.1 RNA-binding S1 domain-containing protein [Psychromonas sp. CNPT3]